MQIPYYVLLIIYLVGILTFLIMTFFNMYHLLRFGFFDFTGKLNAFVFIGFSLTIITISILLLMNVPWLNSFDIANIFNGLLTHPSGSTKGLI